jgi:prepilin-type N-terminal cleavage/methylation domain-containing protein
MQTSPVQSGFTIIEMIVSLAVFGVVITIAVGALLMLIATNRQLQGEQSVMTNLSFALDSMTREIRTGTHYYCLSHPNTSGPGRLFDNTTDIDTLLNVVASDPLDDKTDDCPNGNNSTHQYHGLAFNEGGNSLGGTKQRILYFYDSVDKKIFRKIGNQTPQSIVSSGISIDKMEFFVSGSTRLNSVGSNREDQATVTIFIEATENADPTAEKYRIQTTVTQRTLDI